MKKVFEKNNEFVIHMKKCNRYSICVYLCRPIISKLIRLAVYYIL